MQFVDDLGVAWLNWITAAVLGTALVFVACLVLERVLSRRISPRMWMGLYCLVFARLAVPSWAAGPSARGELPSTEAWLYWEGIAVPKVVSESAALPLASASSLPSWPTVIGLVYLVVVAVLVGRLLAGALSLRRILSQSVPDGVRDGVRVLFHPTQGPLACGLLRPAVVVPRSVLELPDEVSRLVFRHELAHHRGRDPWIAGLLRWSCAVLWPRSSATGEG